MPEREKVIDSLEADAQSCGDMVLIPIETYYDTLELLKEQPEIVRCKHCKWNTLSEIADDTAYCHLTQTGHHEDWFCTDGEVKDNA